MDVRFASGVRVGALTIDPLRRVGAAFWTHRPARRPSARQVLASAELAACWPDALAIPFGASVVAMGLRLELLPTGYGRGGAAVLLSEDGRRTLIVGPTTDRLEPRHADRLVLAAPAPPDPEGWLAAVEASGRRPLRLVVPDAAAAQVVADRLAALGVPHGRPRWVGGGDPRAPVRITTRGAGVIADARPQADEAFLVDLARTVAPELVLVHGARAEPLAAALGRVGLATRVLHAPRQLALTGLGAGRGLAPTLAGD